MLAASFSITPYAAMARPVAGSRGNSIVIAVPGSPKAAKENVEAVLKLLPHACDLACGGNSRMMHSERNFAENGKGVMDDKKRTHAGHDTTKHEHHHGHGGVKPRTTEEERVLLSNQLGVKGKKPISLTKLVTQRHRSSPYPMLSVPDATDKILANTPDLGTVTLPVNDDLVGYLLAEDIKAPESVPAFRASIVDGYAVICKASFEIAHRSI
jgi:gephyrin